ncbi:MAG: NTP/NDP exchange transporter [Burkholderiales bacterium]
MNTTTPSPLLTRLVDVRRHELAATMWSFAYFFCLLCCYYILRPVRDDMGIQGGVANLPWLFSGTFVVMLAAVPLFGWLSSRFPRRQLLPIVYLFFAVNILLFVLLFRWNIAPETVARAFFIWVSVFNLFVVSVFWSFMADLFRNEQARRLFGFISAGGSAGALVGPSLTAMLATEIGGTGLLPISAALLLVSILCIYRLSAWSEGARSGKADARAGDMGPSLGGKILAGVTQILKTPYLMGICLYVLLGTILGTFLYFHQANIIATEFTTSGERTAMFAKIDLAVNILTLVLQLFFVGKLIARFGVGKTLMVLPALAVAGFLVIGLWPTLAVLVVFQVLRRAGEYAIAKPAREVLFTVLSREEKYKSKNFIDTVVFRGGDAISGWMFEGLRILGMGLSAIAFAGVPLALLWASTGWMLGRSQEELRAKLEASRRRQAREELAAQNAQDSGSVGTVAPDRAG